MARLASVVTLTLCSTLSLTAATAETPVAEISQLRLCSSFWQNLHHFLYVSAWATRPAAPRGPRRRRSIRP
jgi:hypothetical protein